MSNKAPLPFPSAAGAAPACRPCPGTCSDPVSVLTCSRFRCELARGSAESRAGTSSNPAPRSKACKVHPNFSSGCPELALPSPYLADAGLTMVARSCSDCPCRSLLHETEVFSGQGELVFPGSCSAPGYSKGVSGSVGFLSMLY